MVNNVTPLRSQQQPSPDCPVCEGRGRVRAHKPGRKADICLIVRCPACVGCTPPKTEEKP